MTKWNSVYSSFIFPLGKGPFAKMSPPSTQLFTKHGALEIGLSRFLLFLPCRARGEWGDSHPMSLVGEEGSQACARKRVRLFDRRDGEPKNTSCKDQPAPSRAASDL